MLVRAYRNEVGVVVVQRQQVSELARRLLVLGSVYLRHQSADAREYVYRGVVILRRDLTRKNDVSVDDTADCIRYRLVGVVALNEHGVDTGYRAFREVPGALEQLRHAAVN